MSSITIAARPYTLSYDAHGWGAQPLTSEEARRMVDAYPLVSHNGDRLILQGDGFRMTLTPATLGGGPAFTVTGDDIPADPSTAADPQILAYTYDADVHCPSCALERWGATALIDGEGLNSDTFERESIGVVFRWDEWADVSADRGCQVLACGTCRRELDTVHLPYGHSPDCPNGDDDDTDGTDDASALGTAGQGCITGLVTDWQSSVEARQHPDTYIAWLRAQAAAARRRAQMVPELVATYHGRGPSGHAGVPDTQIAAFSATYEESATQEADAYAAWAQAYAAYVEAAQAEMVATYGREVIGSAHAAHNG